MSTSIYALYDPRIPGLPFYVGKGLTKRAQYHWSHFLRTGRAVNALLRRWFKQLFADGVEPSFIFLEENVSNWQEAEKDWIAASRRINSQLCNVADGGNCWPIESSSLGGKIGGRKGGLKGGKRVHELHPDLMKEAGRKGIRRACELNPGLRSRMGFIGGKVTGSKNISNAWKNSRDKMLANQRAVASLGGKIGSKKMHELHPGVASRHALHTRWHVHRGVVNPNCSLCTNA